MQINRKVAILKLVFVYLGDSLPEYALLNIRLVQNRFPGYETVLLVDSPFLFQDCVQVGLPVTLIDSPENSWKKIKDMTGHTAEFRDNFWFKTVARFDALRSYMRLQPECRILHIEADVLLSPSFPLHFFDTNEDIGVAYPITNFDQGVASTFYIRNLESLEHFLGYCETCFESNPDSTDVSILGSYYRDYPEFCWILPTAPNSNVNFNSHVNEDLKKIMSENFPSFQGVFDASTWGQYFTGHDPKNSVGITPIFQNQDHHAVRTNGLVFRVDVNGRMYIGFSSGEIEIFSLHIHSKLETLFNFELSAQELTRISTLQNRGVVRKFKFSLFLKLFPSYLKYRMRLVARKVFRNGE